MADKYSFRKMVAVPIFPKYVFFAAVIIMASLMTSCSSHDKDIKAKLILLEKINVNYYNLTDQGVKAVDFQYDSSKFNGISSQLNNKELATLVNNIEFLAQWRGGTDVSILIRNIPKLKNSTARVGLDKILSGTKAEIRGLFLILAPSFESLIKYRNNVALSIKEDANGMTLELAHKLKPMKEVLYFDRQLKLLKTETYENGKLASTSEMRFDLYQGKYLLREVVTKILLKAKMRTDVKIKYREVDGVNLPFDITLDSTRNELLIKNEIKLIPTSLKKQ